MQFLADNWIWFATWPLWAPLSMLVWYAIGIQVERGGLWRVLMPFTFLGFLYDVLLQYTLFQLYFWEIAPKSEFTISMRLGRLVSRSDWRGVWARRLAWLLNKMSPKGIHVPMSP